MKVFHNNILSEIKNLIEITTLSIFKPCRKGPRHASHAEKDQLIAVLLNILCIILKIYIFCVLL